MNIDLEGQVVIVTGAGRGIGREIALMAGESGARVVVAARSSEQLEEVGGEVERRGGQALPLTVDVTDENAVRDMVKTTRERFGRIDGLVNNAATNYVANLVMSKDAEVRRLYEVNVFAVFRCTQAVLRTMIAQKSGRIITISSVSAKLGAAYNSAYASSKAAVIGFTKSVAKETARLGITVNAICPWHVETELVHEAMARRAKMFGKTAEDYLAEIIANSPQQRLVTAREVGATAMLLLSREGQGITGQAINVCGGNAMD